MKTSLTRFALHRPVTTIMVSLTFIALGVIAWQRLPLKFLPTIEAPFLVCAIPYPGSTPEQVANEIAIPAEGLFRTIPGLTRIDTTSNTDGCTAVLVFDLDTNMQLASAELRDRIERLKLVLPSEVDRVLINRFGTNDLPIMAVGLFREGDLEEFNYLARKIIEPQLARIDGIAQVQIHSAVPEREVLIEFDQETLRSLHLDITRLVYTLQSNSINVSAGELADGRREYLVRTLGEFRSLEDIEDVVISPTGLRLKDVASVQLRARDDEMHVSLDGKPGVVLLVLAEQQANTVAACQEVRKELDRVLTEKSFDGVDKMVFLDQAELITGALDNLFKAGCYGGAMALLVLIVFLHRLRPTVIVALAIPTSLVLAMVFMFFAGMTLNLVTMVSLIISVGMLVDNAIVVVENVIRYRALGLPPFESACRGAEEVSTAIFASTATTWVVFLPIIYMEAGSMEVFMLQLGLPLMVGLGASLLIALTLIPLAMSRIHPMRTETQERIRRIPGEARIEAWANALRPVQRIIAFYLFLLRLVLRWRLATALILLALTAATLSTPMGALGMRDNPELDTREVTVNISLDQNVSLEQGGSIFAQVEDLFNGWRDEFGIKSILNLHSRDGGQIEAYLYSDTEPGPEGTPVLKTEEVQKTVADRLPKRLPGAEIECEVARSGQMRDSDGLMVRLRGDDAPTLDRIAERLQRVLSGLPSVREVLPGTEHQRLEIGIAIDEQLARKAGATPLAIARTVDNALRGARLPALKLGEREVPVWAQFREEDRKSKANLDNVAVATSAGNLIPLNQLVDYAKQPSPAAIHRVDGKNVIRLRVIPEGENILKLRNEITPALAQFDLPPGYSFDFGRQFEEMGQNMANFSAALLMAIVLIYLVMSAVFESLLLPLSVLTTVPMALGGSVWALYFSHTSLDTITLVGCILMAGIIVNNGIVIVDHINALRQRGLPRSQALLEGGRDRFRPVLMTALTTMLGLAPLAFATSGGALTFAGLGRALIGGLATGTFLTLLAVPYFYSILDDFQQWALRFTGAIMAVLRPGPREEQT